MRECDLVYKPPKTKTESVDEKLSWLGKEWKIKARPEKKEKK
jgi:hypothetical protein